VPFRGNRSVPHTSAIPAELGVEVLDSWLLSSKLAVARTTVYSPSGIQGATRQATNIHRPRKPLRDDRAKAENRDQHRKV
jgi:hypothetical protein